MQKNNIMSKILVQIQLFSSSWDGVPLNFAYRPYKIAFFQNLVKLPH